MTCRSEKQKQRYVEVGVGQPCLDGHMEVNNIVLEFLCSHGELAPADDSMETHTGTTYESEVPCREEGNTNLVGDELLQEQVEARAGHTLGYEELVLGPIFEDLNAGVQGKHVCLAMQQVEANGRVLLLYVMLWIHVVLKVSL
ncbi:hypothetical protein GOP47_0010865 [Adiantum capillus-veneris]|uniref:Uncharacterized protein n=1 Tax=Adiantum capillus-veneris TaxID=13818 RepID=A0A9D4ZGT3_ADICA|nr:hypothetical protein GOP47_0010865 [Adiantum capillus-veneris]